MSAPKKDIGVLGDDAFVLGFQLAGIRRVWTAGSPKEFEAAADRIMKGEEKNLGILVVKADDVQHLNPHSRKKFTESLDPVVIQIGGAGGDLREKVKRAIGIDLYKE